MYGKKYNVKTGARGVPRSAHNHALTSAIYMQLGIILTIINFLEKHLKITNMQLDLEVYL